MLAEIRNAKTYLEIGVWRGYTFLNVRMPHKTGVAPEFKFDTHRCGSDGCSYLFPVTSDEFFETFDNKVTTRYGEKVTFDIIYIDGFHSYQQAFRDFINTQKHTHENTIWIFDDTVPSDPWSSLPDLVKNNELRQIAGVPIGPWHGDVYKCIFMLHDFYPLFSYATIIDKGNPQTVVWRTREKSSRHPIYGDKNLIDKINYFDMLQNYHVLNPIYDEELIGIIGTSYDGVPSTIPIDKLVNKISFGTTY